MKIITKPFKILALLLVMMGINKSYSQTCTASFNYNVQPNGTVTFTSNSLGTNSINTQYYWTFGNGQTFTATGGFGMVTTTNYTASGIYTVSLFFLTVPSCSAATSQTIAVNISPTPTCAITINTTAATSTNICNGTLAIAGSATVVNVSGLCGPPSFTWFPGGMTGPAAFQLCPNTVYTVIASGGSGTNCCSSVSNTFAINGPTTSPCNLNANFTYTNGANGLVNFNNTSTGTNSVLSSFFWGFSNGQTSSAPNPPSQTYTANGQYLVWLVVSNGPSCTDSISQLITVNNVTNSPCNINANFQYTLGANGLVNFGNTSTGVVNPFTTLWIFGNGQQSTSFHASTTYTANGSYPVLMVVANTNTTLPLCIDSITQIININNIPTPCNLNASFGYSVGANGQVNFYSTSTGTLAGTAYFWNFGDGTTALGVNPIHTYPSSGSYFVIMTAINNSVNCMSTASTAINVTGINCVANSNFSVSPTNTAQVWTATPAFPWNVSAAVWSWGDGSSSNGLYSSHTYSAAGNYQICLSVTVNCSNSSSTCATYSISKMSAANAMVHINVIPPQLTEVGISETLLVDQFNFYPNPNQGILNLDLRSENKATIHVHIMDLNGKAVYSGSVKSESEKINLEHLSNGVYILQLEQAGQHLNKKLIISKD